MNHNQLAHTRVSHGTERLLGRTAISLQILAQKPILRRLADSIQWESFRPLLNNCYAQEQGW
jgi:hypothetical protein